jgi:hypothetical protein
LKHSMFYGTGLVEGLNKEENKQWANY